MAARASSRRLFVFSLCFFCLFAPLDVVIFASSNLQHNLCVSTTSRHLRRPRSTRPTRMGGLASFLTLCTTGWPSRTSLAACKALASNKLQLWTLCVLQTIAFVAFRDALLLAAVSH